MVPILITTIIPEHKPGQAPDHEEIGKKLDDLVKHHFMGKRVVIRCIGSQDHSILSLEELTNKILKSGTDKYNPDRMGLGSKEFNEKGIIVDFYGEKLEISKDTTFMPQQIWEMHHSAIGDRGYGVHVDLVLIYDAVQLDMIMNLYDDHPTSDGFTFKAPSKKKDALLGIIKIKGH